MTKEPVITLEEIEAALEGRVYLVSHGGVGSEELTKKLQITYPKILVGAKARPFRGAFVHTPMPPRHGSRMGIYLYGELYQAIVSQMRRHPDNPSKLKNDESYPFIHSIDEMSRIQDDDPFGIATQFNNFCKADVSYPIIYVKRESLKITFPVLAELLGIQNPENWEERERSTKLSSLTDSERGKLQAIYGRLNTLMSECPDIAIRYPREFKYAKDYSSYFHLSENYDWILTIALEAFKVTYGDLPDDRTPRIKHVIPLPNNYFCFNLRFDKFNELGSNVSATTSFILVVQIIQNQLNPGSIKFMSNEKAVTSFDKKILYSGFEDPRSIIYKGQAIIFANAPIFDGNRRLFQFNFNSGITNIVDVSGMVLSKEEKNWIPYVENEELYLIYSLNPFSLLKCISIETAEYLSLSSHENQITPEYPWGGTPLIRWIPPYFIGFAHSRHPDRVVPVLLNAETHDVIYGNPLELCKPDYVTEWRGKSVQYPYHLEMLGSKIRLFVGLEDKCSAAYTVDLCRFSELFSSLSHQQGSNLSLSYNNPRRSGFNRLISHNQFILKIIRILKKLRNRVKIVLGFTS